MVSLHPLLAPFPPIQEPLLSLQVRFRLKSPSGHSKTVDFFRGATGSAAREGSLRGTPPGVVVGWGRDCQAAPAGPGGARWGKAAMQLVPRGSGGKRDPSKPRRRSASPGARSCVVCVRIPGAHLSRWSPAAGCFGPPAGICPCSRAGGGDPHSGPLPRGSGRGGPTPCGIPRPRTSVTPSSPQQLGLMTSCGRFFRPAEVVINGWGGGGKSPLLLERNRSQQSLCRGVSGGAPWGTRSHSSKAACGPDPANLPPLLQPGQHPGAWGGPAGLAEFTRASKEARGLVQLN